MRGDWQGSAYVEMLGGDMTSEHPLATIHFVNLGMIGVRPAYRVSVDAGEGEEMTVDDIKRQHDGYHNSLRDVVKTRWVARLLAESFIEQRGIYKLQ